MDRAFCPGGRVLDTRLVSIPRFLRLGAVAPLLLALPRFSEPTSRLDEET
jgi:hypothetical protein